MTLKKTHRAREMDSLTNHKLLEQKDLGLKKVSNGEGGIRAPGVGVYPLDGLAICITPHPFLCAENWVIKRVCTESKPRL